MRARIKHVLLAGRLYDASAQAPGPSLSHSFLHPCVPSASHGPGRVLERCGSTAMTLEESTLTGAVCWINVSNTPALAQGPRLVCSLSPPPPPSPDRPHSATSMAFLEGRPRPSSTGLRARPCDISGGLLGLPLMAMAGRGGAQV